MQLAAQTVEATAAQTVKATAVLRGDGISSVDDFNNDNNQKQIKEVFGTLQHVYDRNTIDITVERTPNLDFFATKKGGCVPTWLRRYFRYNTSTQEITYYENVSSGESATDIQIRPQDCLGTIQVQDVQKRGDMIEITDKSGRVYYLRNFSKNMESLVKTFNDGVMKVTISMVCDSQQTQDHNFIASKTIAAYLREALTHVKLISPETILHVENIHV